MFKRFADALEHVLQHNYGISDLLHYLDDFFAVGPPDSRIETSVAGVQMRTVLAISDALNIPVAEGDDKVVHPPTELPRLGILDSVCWEMHLPDSKLSALRTKIEIWVHCTSCTKRELLSFIGRCHLQPRSSSQDEPLFIGCWMK